MRLAGAALGMLLLASTVAAAEEVRPSGPAEPAASDRQEVQTAQVLLHLLGLYDGNANGTFGPQTQKAVADYQQKLGLGVTGLLDERTVFALKNPGKVSACVDAHIPIAACLDAAPATAATTAPTTATDPCDDPKLPVERCLQAISQMERFLTSRSKDKR